MKFIGAFFQFARRVLAAAKKGGLSAKDTVKLDNLLTRTGKRNVVLAKGILSALSIGGASKEDITRFGKLLQKAEGRIYAGKEPFSKADREELSEIFQRAYLSAKVTRWFSAQVDELLAEEINEFISGKRRMEIGVPKKKTVRFEMEEEPKKAKKKGRKIRA